MGKITGYSYYPQFFHDPQTGEKGIVYRPNLIPSMPLLTLVLTEIYSLYILLHI